MAALVRRPRSQRRTLLRLGRRPPARRRGTRRRQAHPQAVGAGPPPPVVEEREGDTPTRRRWMLARRSITDPEDIAYFLASAPLNATLADLARIAGCRWKIEECFQSGKNECCRDEGEVRRYTGWYRHITLAMLAHAFLAAIAAQERERGAPATTRPISWTSHRPRSAVSWQPNPRTTPHATTTR